jgi:hypothetical protein
MADENGTGFNRAVCWKDNYLKVIQSIAKDEPRPAHSRHLSRRMSDAIHNMARRTIAT